MILKPNQVVVICDSREQRPFDLTPLKMKTGTLATGDYALAAAPDYVAIERKSASDLLGCIGHGRERFERELQRLLAYPRRIVLLECSYSDLLNHPRTQLAPASIAGTIAAWSGRYCGFHFAGNRRDAQDFAGRFLLIAAREMWEKAEAFREAIEGREGGT